MCPTKHNGVLSLLAYGKDVEYQTQDAGNENTDATDNVYDTEGGCNLDQVAFSDF